MNPWEKKRRIESDYANSMKKLTDYFFNKAVSGMSDLEQVQERLRSAGADSKFQDFARSLAHHMVTGLKVETAQTWKKAASQSSEGAKIYQMLSQEQTGARVNELIRQNAELISSLPLKVAQDLNVFIQKQQMAGKRFNVMNVNKYVIGLTKTRIALIARTETSKASTALTRTRAEDLGLDWYVWRTSKDGRVRNSHSHMDGVLVNWNDAPSPEQLKGIRSKLGAYHAGDAPNCRCYPEPVVSLSSVRWPMKMYHNGSISMVTRSNFERMNGLQRAA